MTPDGQIEAHDLEALELEFHLIEGTETLTVRCRDVTLFAEIDLPPGGHEEYDDYALWHGHPFVDDEVRRAFHRSVAAGVDDWRERTGRLLP